MMALFFAVLASLFSVVNPLGAVPVFLAMTPGYSNLERRKIALHTSIYFVLILLSFFLAGTAILGFFGISLDAMRIAGGLVILSSGYALLNGKFEQKRVPDKVKKEALQKEDISFSPMAMPLLAGPGSISLLIALFAENELWTERGLIMGVILTTGLIVFGILALAPSLFKILGQGGLRAISRIMGFLVMAIAIQYIIMGIVSLVETLSLT